MNGGKLKNQDEMTYELSEDGSLKEIIKATCKKLGGGADYHKAKIFNKNGILLHETDFGLINPGDILYCAIKGEDFSYSCILDDYELGKTLGVGGFGKVILGKNKETK